MLGILLPAAPAMSAIPNSTAHTNDTLQIMGSCIGHKGPIALAQVMFLENRVLNWEGASTPIRISLSRQSASIKLLKAPKGDTFVHNIGVLVGDGTVEPDIYLKIAIFDKKPMIYWRETYQHRIYRQGIFAVSGHKLVRLCEGEGGETVMD
jgi:hypothetical protein